MTYIIAELGSNWDPYAPRSSIERLVAAAARAGVDAVKMQDWSPIDDMARADEWKGRCRAWTVDSEVLATADRAAKEHGLGMFCSVFTVDAVQRAWANIVRTVKLASSELTNHALIATIQMSMLSREVGRMIDANENVVRGTRRGFETVYVSLGEVRSSYEVTTLISRLNMLNIVLMGCVSEYPVQRPLDLLDSLSYAQQFGLPAGISSHVAYPDAARVCAAAVKRGAMAVEAHMRDAGCTPEDAPDNGPWALYPNELAEVVAAVRRAGGE